MFELKIGQEAGMDAYALVASISQTLAWPVALVVIVWLIRSRIGDSLTRLAEISFPGGSLKFAEKLDEIKLAAADAVAAQTDSDARIAGPPDSMSDSNQNEKELMNRRDPELMVVRSYLGVE